MSIGFIAFERWGIQDYVSYIFPPNQSIYYIKIDPPISTSFSAHNVIAIDNVFTATCKKRIPVLDTSIDFDSKEQMEDYIRNRIIPPKEMSAMCSKVLAGTEIDECDMRDRVEWLKKLSDTGYYLAYVN